MVNYIDIALLAIIAIFTVKGFVRGLIGEVLGLLGIFAGFILATRFMSNAAEIIEIYVDLPPALTSLLGYLIVFIGVQLATQVVIHVLESLTEFFLIGLVFQLLGATFGAIKGALVASLLVLLITILPMTESLIPGMDDSIVLPYIRKIAPQVYDFISDYVADSKSFHDEIKESLDIKAIPLDQHTEKFLRSLAKEIPIPKNLTDN